MTRNVQIRLDDEAWSRYSAAAMLHRRTLAGHLKVVLEDDHLRLTVALERMAEDSLFSFALPCPGQKATKSGRNTTI